MPSLTCSRHFFAKIFELLTELLKFFHRYFCTFYHFIATSEVGLGKFVQCSMNPIVCLLSLGLPCLTLKVESSHNFISHVRLIVICYELYAFHPSQLLLELRISDWVPLLFANYLEVIVQMPDWMHTLICKSCRPTWWKVMARLLYKQEVLWLVSRIHLPFVRQNWN